MSYFSILIKPTNQDNTEHVTELDDGAASDEFTVYYYYYYWHGNGLGQLSTPLMYFFSVEAQYMGFVWRPISVSEREKK